MRFSWVRTTWLVSGQQVILLLQQNRLEPLRAGEKTASEHRRNDNGLRRRAFWLRTVRPSACLRLNGNVAGSSIAADSRSISCVSGASDSRCRVRVRHETHDEATY